MKESTLTRRILDVLNRHDDCKAVKFHVGGYGETGTPDIIGCFDGRAFLIEVKVSGRRLTPLQEHRCCYWRRVGARVEVAREDFDVSAFLETLAEDIT